MSQKGREFFKLVPSVFDLFPRWAQMGPQASPKGAQGVILTLSWSLFHNCSRIFLLPCTRQKKQNPIHLPQKRPAFRPVFKVQTKRLQMAPDRVCPKKGQHSALFSVCATDDFRWPHLGSCPQQRGPVAEQARSAVDTPRQADRPALGMG